MECSWKTDRWSEGWWPVESKADRKIRIEVGYGLEGRLTDLLAGRIIRNVIAPHFRSGAFDQGIAAGISAMIDAVQGEFSAGELQDLPIDGRPLWEMPRLEDLAEALKDKAPLLLEPRDPVLYCVQTLRDEAHRFAIGYHRKTRSKRTLHSELDDISGIGPAKLEALRAYRSQFVANEGNAGIIQMIRESASMWGAMARLVSGRRYHRI